MLEIEYIEATDEYNISGNKYSVEEAETIAHFITSKEFDKYVGRVDEYKQQDWNNDIAHQEINYKRGQ
jgi:mannose/cellobiose epimerase-like protein (N-acyl-D-glucosamine 2-epimerase family)